MRNVTGHKISFFGTNDEADMIPRTSAMANSDYRWTAVCSCGFATDDSVKMAEADRQVLAHKVQAAQYAAEVETADAGPIVVRTVERIATTGRYQWAVLEDGVVVEKYRSAKQANAAY